MVQGVTGGHERALELTQIDEHSSLSIWLATHRHFSAIGMTMNAAARFRFDRTLKGVCGFKPKLLETKTGQFVWIQPVLGIDQLEFVTAAHPQRRACLGADADPIEPLRDLACPVRFHGGLEAASVNSVKHRAVELQQRLPAGEDHEPPRRKIPPGSLDRLAEVFGVVKFAAADPIRADKIRVTEPADCMRSIHLAPGPQITTSEAAEHGGTTCLCSLALQRLEYLLDGIDHGSSLQAPGTTLNSGVSVTAPARCDRSSPRTRVISCWFTFGAPSNGACRRRPNPITGDLGGPSRQTTQSLNWFLLYRVGGQSAEIAPLDGF